MRLAGLQGAWLCAATLAEAVPAGRPRTALPRVYGRYQLFDLIGKGGMADIYLARATTELGGTRRVVVKEILPELSGDATFAELLTNEAKLAAQLSQQNVVQVFDLGREQDSLFIAMEYVEGYDLNQLLSQLSKRRIGLPPEFALFIVREVLAGLDYAHRAQDDRGELLGIVHRDVSPSNVLVSFEGEVKLCDFGIARAVDPEHATDAGGSRAAAAGKGAYMAPEQARGEDVDSRSDVFAAGILLWELCAGRRLYRGSHEEVLQRARAADIPPLPDRGLARFEELTAVLGHALAPDPASRFQSAAEFRRALDRYAVGAGLMASQLRFARFLTDHFGEDMVTLRRERERAAEITLAEVARREETRLRRERHGRMPRYRVWLGLALTAALAAGWFFYSR